jgi:hypothetical protein
MSTGPTGRLVILSGPSCVGKSPLDKALGRFYPEVCGNAWCLTAVPRVRAKSTAWIVIFGNVAELKL